MPTFTSPPNFDGRVGLQSQHITGVGKGGEQHMGQVCYPAVGTAGGWGFCGTSGSSWHLGAPGWK